MTDEDDLKLQQLFSMPEINDDGFSLQVNKTILKRHRIRQFSLGTAFMTGGLIAFQSLLDVMGLLSVFFNELPLRWSEIPVATPVQLSSLMFLGLSAVLLFFLLPVTEE